MVKKAEPATLRIPADQLKLLLGKPLDDLFEEIKAKQGQLSIAGTNILVEDIKIDYPRAEEYYFSPGQPPSILPEYKPKPVATIRFFVREITT